MLKKRGRPAGSKNKSKVLPHSSTPKVGVAGRVEPQTDAVKLYQVAFTTGDFNLSSEGETLLEAFDNLPLPPKVTAKGFFEVKYKDKTRKFMMYVLPMRRFFANKNNRALWAKRTEMMLK